MGELKARFFLKIPIAYVFQTPEPILVQCHISIPLENVRKNKNAY